MKNASRKRPAPARKAPAGLLVPVGLLALAGLLTYWNSLGVPFLWDDETAIVTNRTIQHLWPLRDPLSPPLETPVSGRPVVNFSLAINYAAGGLNVGGYHLLNLGIHLTCALLLFGIIRRTLSRVRRNDAPVWPADASALVATLIWMVHPLQSEVVDYVTQRTESMMGLFLLLTLYAAIRARHSIHEARWTAAAIASCALGMATKESMATAPLVVLLYDRVFEFDSMREAVRARKYLYAGLAATWVELVVLMRHWPRSTVGFAASDPFTYLLNQTQMIVRYLKLTVWPRALVLDYGLPRLLTIREVAPDALLLVALAAATLIALARRPAIGFLGAVFFLTLAPSSSVIPIASEVGSERRMYLPLAASSVLVVVLVQLVVDRLVAERAGRRRAFVRAAAAAAAVVIVVLAVRTIYRNADYATPLSVWQTVIERRPQGRARMAFATELIAAGRRDEAMAQLREAVRDYPDARAALGSELYFDGHMDEAARELEAFIRANPSKPDRIPARILLGRALTAQGKLDDAVSQLRSVLDQAPSNVLARQSLAEVGTAHRNVANTALRNREADKAAAHAREALGLDARDGEAHNLLGVALATQGKLDEAIAEFRQALELKPDDTQARNNLAHALDLQRARR